MHQSPVTALRTVSASRSASKRNKGSSDSFCPKCGLVIQWSTMLSERTQCAAELRAEIQTIDSAAKLAEVMAGKARLMADVIEKILSKEVETNQFAKLMAAFKDRLIHDITPKKFADVYAQTIVYGMFAARRLSDANSNHFNHDTVANIVPESIPVLRDLFHNIEDRNIDDRIRWIVDELARIFQETKMENIMHDERVPQNNPIIHFYEDFLTAYNPKDRKNYGAWYTPQTVVNFIVRAVDEILQRNFNLSNGLADASKVKTTQINQLGEAEEVHKVQILDPAVGTGAFLVETVNHIYKKNFRGQEGKWQKYVDEHLLPRLNGFEVSMAPYTIAHINLDWVLKHQKNYESTKSQRFRIYLTNSLDPPPSSQEPFHHFLAQETDAANPIKGKHRKVNAPVMVVMGNPPYNVRSKNKSDWIVRLLEDYKKGLNETNIQPLSNDYIKFIRCGQHFIEVNGEGILAYISSNSFLDGLIHRQMRKHLLETFDVIYIIDLHGNANKKETHPDGSKDENVFNIREGVSINLFVKTGCKATNALATVALATVFHFDLYGKRTDKFDFLSNNSLETIPWHVLEFDANDDDDNYFFVPKDFTLKEEYDKGFKIDELFLFHSSGTKFRKDNLLVKKNFTRADVKQMLEILNTGTDEEIQKRYALKETSDWTLKDKKQLFAQPDYNDIRVVQYRLFDYRYTYYPLSKIDKIIVRGDSRKNLMRHFIVGENVGLLTCRQQTGFDFQHLFVSNVMVDMGILSNFPSESAYFFPLYLYPESKGPLGNGNRRLNLNKAITDEISRRIGLRFSDDKESTENRFAPIDVLDYLYAVLHSSAYRAKYKELLKIGFPRVPYPENAKQFCVLAALGGKLRRLHLLEGVVPLPDTATFPIAGTCEVETLRYTDGKVYINDMQYFDRVPPDAWNFTIGGHQPAKKWLKDRKKRTLNCDDIEHYQKIIRVLKETKEIMDEVDAC